MENRTKLEAGVIIALLVLSTGTYFIGQEDQAYYCEAKDMVMLCEKLSSGLGTRCYYEDTYKICKLGWEKIEIGQEVQGYIPGDVPVSTLGKKWLCSPERCVRIE